MVPLNECSRSFSRRYPFLGKPVSKDTAAVVPGTATDFFISEITAPTMCSQLSGTEPCQIELQRTDVSDKTSAMR